MRTIQQRLCEALERRGYERVADAKTRRYVVYTRGKTDFVYYVGKAGALRKGNTIGSSLHATRMKATLLVEVPE